MWKLCLDMWLGVDGENKALRLKMVLLWCGKLGFDVRLGVMRIIVAPRLESREMLGAEKMLFLPRLMVSEI